MARWRFIWFAAAFGALIAPGAASADPAAAAQRFVESLSADERADALKSFDDADRRRFRFTPGSRGGLPLQRMDAGTEAAAFALLDAALSAEGRSLVDQIIQREAILGRLTGRPDYRDPSLYYLALFGAPGDAAWAFRFEGHHLSINFTYARDALIAVTPLSLGSNPEATDAPGAPPVLLGPLVALAEAAPEGMAARRALGAALLALVPEPDRSATVEALLAAGAFETARGARAGFVLTGGGATLDVETARRNHIHLTLVNTATDFGGPP